MKRGAIPVAFVLATLVLASCQTGGGKQTTPVETQPTPSAPAVMSRAFVVDVVRADDKTHLWPMNGDTVAIQLQITPSDSGVVYKWFDKPKSAPLVNEEIGIAQGNKCKILIEFKNPDDSLMVNMKIRHLYWKHYTPGTGPMDKIWGKTVHPNGKGITIDDLGAPVGRYKFGLILFNQGEPFVADPTIVEDEGGMGGK